MSLLETVIAAVATKTGAAAVGLTVAAGSVGAAGAADVLPEDVQRAFDRAIGVEQSAEDAAEPQQADGVEDAGEADADDQGVAREVHDQLNGDQDAWPGDEGFGEAVAENAQEGGEEFGQSVADAASDGRSTEGRETGEEAADENAADAGAPEDLPTPDEAEGDEGDDAGRPEDAGAPEDAGSPEDLPEQAGPGADAAAGAR